MATRSLSKDIEDECISIEHSKANEFFEVTFLTRRERVIDQDHLGATVDRCLTNLLGLTAAHEVPRVRSLAATCDRDGRAHSRRLRELRELLEIFAFYRPIKTNANENGAFAAAGTLKHVWSRSFDGRGIRVALFLTVNGDTNVSRRDDR